MSTNIVECFVQEQSTKIQKIQDFYQSKINEGTCFSKSIVSDIEQQMKIRMSLDEILNYWKLN